MEEVRELASLREVRLLKPPVHPRPREAVLEGATLVGMVYIGLDKDRADGLAPMLGLTQLSNYLTLEGSFAAASTARIARKDAFCSIKVF